MIQDLICLLFSYLEDNDIIKLYKKDSNDKFFIKYSEIKNI
jgi:hypothetical protein